MYVVGQQYKIFSNNEHNHSWIFTKILEQDEFGYPEITLLEVSEEDKADYYKCDRASLQSQNFTLLLL